MNRTSACWRRSQKPERSRSPMKDPAPGRSASPSACESCWVSPVLPEGEPAVDAWRAVDEREFVELVLSCAGTPAGRPRIVAVDGRGAAGKSTLAARLTDAVPNSAVVHTDDLAWNEPFFAWGHLLTLVLESLHGGHSAHLEPPAWTIHGRQGAIEVPSGLDLVVVEGVGASQREHVHLLDATLWVQSDFDEAETRGIARDIEQGSNGQENETVAFWHEWMEHELRFLAQQQPWHRADLVVAGTSVMPLRTGQLAVVLGPL